MRELKTVADLLDALQEECGYASDYEAAKALQIPQTTVSAWRIGRAAPREHHALTIAKALKISPVLVLAIAAAERSSSEESRRDWRLVVEHLARATLPAVATLALLTGGYTPPARADEPAMHIPSNRRRRRRAVSGGGPSAAPPRVPPHSAPPSA